MRKVGIILFSLGLAFSLLGCVRDTTPPAVVRTSPAPHSQDVPLDSTISITFTEPMDREGVLRLLQVLPATEVRVEWQGTELLLIPRLPLSPGTEYRVSFAATPSDRAGNLLPDFSLVFKTKAFSAVYKNLETLLWAPDNRSLLFTAESEATPRLYLLNIYNGEVKRVSEAPGYQLEPAINPEGTTIAFVGGVGAPSLYLHDLASAKTTAVKLSMSGLMPGTPRFSPDGSILALYGIIGRAAGHSDIYQSLWVYDLNKESVQLASPEGVSVRFLGFSADSRHLYFLSTYGQYIYAYNFRYDLWVADLLTGEQRQLSHGGLVHNFYAGHQSASDDLFVYSTWEARDIAANIILFPRDLFVLQGDPLEHRPLLIGGSNASPQFSPAGESVLFVSGRGARGGQDLFVMNTRGENIRQLTFTTLAKLFPRWSPDGQRIAFVERQGESFVIYIMNADGTDLRRTMQLELTKQ